jgi:putative flippase GtrA
VTVQVNGWRIKGQLLAEQHQIKIRFLLAGILNTVFGLGTFPVLYFMLAGFKLHYLAILTISQAICITFAFLTNKFLVFRTKGNYMAEFLKFITFHLSYFAVNLLVLPILVELLHFNPVIAQSLFAILVIASSYFWHSRITFLSK